MSSQARAHKTIEFEHAVAGHGLQPSLYMPWFPCYKFLVSRRNFRGQIELETEISREANLESDRETERENM